MAPVKTVEELEQEVVQTLKFFIEFNTGVVDFQANTNAILENAVKTLTLQKDAILSLNQRVAYLEKPWWKKIF